MNFEVDLIHCDCIVNCVSNLFVYYNCNNNKNVNYTNAYTVIINYGNGCMLLASKQWTKW